MLRSLAMNRNFTTKRSLIAILAAASMLAAACGSDDGEATRGEVTEIGGGDDAGSGSASGSGSGSSSAPASDSGDSDPTDGDGGYDYASDVSSHRLVVADICGIGDLLDAGDFAGVETIYREGVNSVNSDGSVRSIGGFASRDDRNHGLDEYYGTPTPLDEFITDALNGTGLFEGTSDAVRAQAVEKGMQNQVMVAWVIHELNSAIAKAEEGSFDIAEGAVHNWDEGWAFYHGAEAGCSPYATGDKRAANFGTVGADGETALANEAILGAMISGRDALLDEDLAGAEAAAGEAIRGLVIIYSQASIRYATLVEGDMAEGDTTKAEEHRAEGLAFFRVIEAIVAGNGADIDAINSVYDFSVEPGANGGGAEVRAALAPAWDALGITDADIGELS